MKWARDCSPIHFYTRIRPPVKISKFELEHDVSYMERGQEIRETLDKGFEARKRQQWEIKRYFVSKLLINFEKSGTCRSTPCLSQIVFAKDKLVLSQLTGASIFLSS